MNILKPEKVGQLSGRINDFIEQPLKYLHVSQQRAYREPNKIPSYYLLNA